MRLYALSGGRSGRPSRSGQPWTDDDYETLVTLCRDGRDLARVAEELCRSEVAVLERARRLLPVAERGLPRDRAVARLQDLLRGDPGYDWSAAMLEAPPPAPVEHRVYRREGIEGLRRQELLAVAEAVVLAGHVDGALRADVLRAVEREGLEEELERQVGGRLVLRAQAADDEWAREEEPPWSLPPRYLGHDGPDRPWCGPECPDDPPPPVAEPEPWW